MSKLYVILTLMIQFNLELNCSETKEIKDELDKYLATDISNLVMDYIKPKKFNITYNDIFTDFLELLPSNNKLLFLTRCEKRPKVFLVSELLINKYKEIVIKVKIKLNDIEYDKYFFYSLNGNKLIKSSNDTDNTLINQIFLEGKSIYISSSNKSIQLFSEYNKILIYDLKNLNVDRIIYGANNHISLFGNILVIGTPKGEISIYKID